MNLLLEITQNTMSLYAALIGVAGTLLGTIIGFVLSLLPKIGKRRFILKEIQFSYDYGFEFGSRIFEKEYNFEGKSPEGTKVDIKLLVTNASDIPFNASSLNLIIVKDKKKYKATLYNKNDKKTSGNGSIITFNSVNSLIVQGKNCEFLELYANFHQVFKNDLKNVYLYIEFINVKGKTKKKKIKLGKLNETKI